MNNSHLSKPQKIVKQMLKNDAFSNWLGIEIIEVFEGGCKLTCIVRDDMLNGYKIAHGGILFSLADSAIAFASATYGRVAVTIDHSISFIKKATAGDQLKVTANTLSMGHKTGVIQVEISNQDEELIGFVKGTVYRTSKKFEF